MSDTLSPNNGVKQGGVHSPILIHVYLEHLINLLTQQEVECYFHAIFYGALSPPNTCEYLEYKADDMRSFHRGT